MLSSVFRGSVKQEDLNFNHLVWDRFWFGLASASGGFLSIYALRVGASPQHLSLMAALPGMMMLLATVFSVPWRKRYLTSAEAQVRPSFAAMFLYLLPAFTPFFPLRWQPLWLVFSVTLPAFAEGLAVGIRLAVMRESVSENLMTSLLSRRQMTLKLMGALGAVAFGLWLEKMPYPLNYQSMYVVAFGLSLLSFWHISQTKPLFIEPTPPPISSLEAWRDPRFQRASVLVLTVFGAYLAVQPLIPARLVEELGASEGFIALYGLVDLIAGTAAAALTVRLVPLMGNRFMTGVAMLLTALAIGIIALTPHLYLTLLAAGLIGMAWTIADIGQFGYFLANIPAENSTHYTTAYIQLISVGGFVTPLVGGFLVGQGLSLTTVLLVGAGLRLAASVLAFSLKD